MINRFTERGDVYETTEITEIRLKEVGDKYKMDLEKLENERVSFVEIHF
ncbi:unnamed protein product [Anisakis simplex]|uniref:Phage protein n=1 Tax=Anisakis simplex TaxID=6269 RepID=A0A0M3JJK7_ANISI|nr:unnamed protein product [Anisakis simplex]